MPSSHFQPSPLLLSEATSHPSNCKPVVQLLGVNAPLHVDQLVAITQHHPAQAGAPLAVGMALLGEEVRARGRREVGQGGAGTAYVKGLPVRDGCR